MSKFIFVNIYVKACAWWLPVPNIFENVEKKALEKEKEAVIFNPFLKFVVISLQNVFSLTPHGSMYFCSSSNS